MKKVTIYLLFSLLFLFLMVPLSAQRSFRFAERDTGWLKLDLYMPAKPLPERPLIVFIYGGGFMHGQRNNPWCVNYCQKLQQQGYVVAAIDYRLGFKGVEKVTPNMLEQAIQMGVQDLTDALKYLYPKYEIFGFDTSQIYLCGYSAGAIIALQTDYYMANNHEITLSLPPQLRFAGVISYSGAIFARECVPKYRYRAPAPTLFLHGTADRIVTYKKIQVFNVGFFGTNTLVKKFDKAHYPYFVRRYLDLGHEVASLYDKTIPLMNYFITTYGFDKRVLRIDETYWDLELPPTKSSKASFRDFQNQTNH